MNDEKTAVINMVSEGTITSSEGIALFEALCDLEDMESYESDVEAEDPKYLPPWESEEENLPRLVGQSKFARAIATANRHIISALQEDKLDDIPSKLAVLDVIQLSAFRPSKPDGNRGFTMGGIHLKPDHKGLQIRGWGMVMSWWMSTELELPPTWADPMLLQAFMASRSLRMKWKADEKMDEERDQVKAVSTIESFDDSVTTKAGRFDDCLRLKKVISARGDAKFEGARKHDINDSLRMIGTQSIWLAPHVGVVKLLYKHPNNTQTEIELADYHVRDAEPLYFPLSPGNKWRYQWQDAVAVHHDLIRVVLRKEDGRFILSCANHIAGIA